MQFICLCFQVSSWGGYVFLINLIPLHVLVLMLTGRFSHRIYVAYCTVYCLGTILSMQISFVGFQVRLNSAIYCLHSGCRKVSDKCLDVKENGGLSIISDTIHLPAPHPFFFFLISRCSPQSTWQHLVCLACARFMHLWTTCAANSMLSNLKFYSRASSPWWASSCCLLVLSSC